MTRLADDIAHAVADARRAHERAGTIPISDEEERAQRLRPVLDGLPPGARAASRKGLEARISPRMLEAVLGWRWGAGNLVLMGETGSGKTSAAAHLVRRLCAEGVARGGVQFELCQMIRWQGCRELSEVVRETRLGTGVPEAITASQNARLLILNDLGGHDDRKTLERILDERYERGWPTVTTTGMRAKGRLSIEEQLGDALARRLFECHGDKGVFVEVWSGAKRNIG